MSVCLFVSLPITFTRNRPMFQCSPIYHLLSDRIVLENAHYADTHAREEFSGQITIFYAINAI